MATVLVPVFAGRLSGADLSAAAMVAAAVGDSFPAGPNTFLRVKNAGASPCIVTVTEPASTGPSGTSFSNFTLIPTVPITTGDRLFGPFPAYPFGDVNGMVTLGYSSVASVTVMAVTVSD